DVEYVPCPMTYGIWHMSYGIGHGTSGPSFPQGIVIRGTRSMWTCPKCGTKVDPSLDVCWRCGTSPEGVEDPSFVPADEAGPIEDPPVAPTLESIHSPPEGELAGTPASELVSCYQAYSLMEAQFLANELNGQGIPA